MVLTTTVSTHSSRGGGGGVCRTQGRPSARQSGEQLHPQCSSCWAGCSIAVLVAVAFLVCGSGGIY